tara:strand:- start:7579 stop:9585 length:2007 start_codon:yes stop_codon:yes gene_type:complete
MARVTKKDINFDVYERADPTSTVDWGEQAKKITDTFEGIRDDRQGRKAEIDKSIEEQQAALNDLGKYDNDTLQQVALDGSNDAANALMDQASMMKRGIVKPHEFNKFKANQKAGWTQFKKNAESWNAKYNEYAERTADGTAASAETWIGQQLEGFNNLKDLKFMTNPEDGSMAYARMDENGDIIEGESISVNQMTNLLNQKVNNFDIGAVVEAQKGRIGKILLAANKGLQVGTQEYSRLETEFIESAEGQKFLEASAKEMYANPFDRQSTMLNAQLTTDDGELYRIGTVEEYNAWEEENGGEGAEIAVETPAITNKAEGNAFRAWVNKNHPEKAKEWDLDATGSFDNKFINKAYKELGGEYSTSEDGLALKPTKGARAQNPILQMNYNGTAYEAEFDENQIEASQKYAEMKITGAQDYTEGLSDKKYKPRGPARSPGNRQLDDLDKQKMSFGKNVNMMLTGDATAARAGMKYLADASDKIRRIEKTATGYMVYNTDGTTNPLNTEGMTAKEGLREVWKAVDAPQGVELDFYLDNKGEVGDAVTYDVLSVDSDIAPMAYVRQPATNFASYTTGLGSSLNYYADGESEVIESYTNMLNDADFYPRGLKQPKVSFSGDDLVISIEGKDYTITDVWSNDNVAAITSEIQGFVQEAVDSHSGGRGGADKYNKE